MSKKRIKIIQCSSSWKCANNECFFRLKDAFHYPSPWDENFDKAEQATFTHAGVDRYLYPTISAEVNEGLINVFCENYIGEN